MLSRYLDVNEDVTERAETTEVYTVSQVTNLPWYVWCLAAAVTCSSLGGYWDISWHISIGRDTFWTPAHIAIYLGGLLAAVASGYTILMATFGPQGATQTTTVSVLGFRGPIGCFLAAWGGIAMIMAGLFDNWWHSAYGLDVKIVSLPHTILIFGEVIINVGAVLVVCAEENRARGIYRKTFDLMLLYVGGIITFAMALFLLESTPLVIMHHTNFYVAVSKGFPIALIAISCVAVSRWPATTMAAIYMALFIAGLWIFPLFPAAPKLGPVYKHVTHMIPLWFPVLLIAPAAGLDLLRQKLDGKWGSWRSGVAAGLVFLGIFVAVQWPFADFLVSSWARNWVFGTIYFGYADPAFINYNPYAFFTDNTKLDFFFGMSRAIVASVVFCSIGMALGNWMRRLQR